MNGNITVAQAVCNGCGLCSRVCSAGAIVVVDGCATLKKPALCCSCGHCAAICPEGAISAGEDNRRAFTVEMLDGGLGPVETLLRSKRSVREFRDGAPTRDELQRLVDYGEKAPSSANNRHRRYLVVTDPHRIDAMEQAALTTYKTILSIMNPAVISAVRLVAAELGKTLSASRDDLRAMQEEAARGHKPIFRGAPCVICVAAPKRDIQAIDDCIIALQYMMLAGETHGIGSCIIGYAEYAHKAIERVCHVPGTHRIYSVGIFGYSRYEYAKEIRYKQAPEVVWL